MIGDHLTPICYSIQSYPDYLPSKISEGVEKIRVNRDISALSGTIQSVSQVMECAKQGIASSGVELNSILVAYSKWNGLTSRSSLSAPVSFRRKDIFKTDIVSYKTAVIFGAESLMGDLVPKLSEMKGGSRLLACRFPLPENGDWQMIEQIGEGIDAVWIYSRKELSQ